ncbi:TetR/AcrR family transcriptional regulator [Patulibacter minatonensis]|uniref:TetR/AcrR family transcriptional regulator n=1 Tax=Patulibacter minatonensis TaxID=298163 RepID=UPI001FE17242|nr:TetR/AcrR family transcriptional regulator [Patulibacter minatonensis]
MSALPGGTAQRTARLTALVDPPPVPDASAPTRERLLFAAREVVEAGGYAGASVAAIALRAGVANGTLYRHFGSKAELFVEVFRDVCGREVAAMRAAVDAAGDDHVERVLAPLDLFSRRALQNRSLAWALLAEPVDALVDEVRLEYRRTYRELLSGVLREAIAAGALPPQDPDLTAAGLVGAVGEALVGPVSAAPGPPTATAGVPRRTAADGAHGPAGEDGDPDDALLAELDALCRRATGAAATVRADAPGQPR